MILFPFTRSSISQKQNSLCRIIFRKSRYSKDHITPYLKSLHWLPITHRIDKWFLLIFKVINFGLPQYFIPFFTPYSCPVFTRCSVSNKMYLNSDIVPFHKVMYKSKTQYDKSFCASGTDKWNSLPESVRCATSVTSFRSKLKGHLFDLAFPP